MFVFQVGLWCWFSGFDFGGRLPDVHEGFPVSVARSGVLGSLGGSRVLIHRVRPSVSGLVPVAWGSGWGGEPWRTPRPKLKF